MKETHQFKVIQLSTKATDLALLCYKISLPELEAIYWCAHQESSDAWEVPGPTLYWGLQFECGLEVVLEFLLTKDYVNVCADLPEIEHILKHLALPKVEMWRIPDDDQMLWRRYTKPDTTWSLWRQDENGHKELFKKYSWEREAYCQLSEFEILGHKQTYWIEKQITG